MPLGGSESISEEGTTQSASVEVDEVLIRCLTSHILLGWVDGILWPLPSVALRPTLQELGTGDWMWGLSDENIH